MKKGTRRLFKDFFYIFAWAAVSVIILCLRYFKIEISDTNIRSILVYIITWAFFFIGYNFAPTKLLFSKKDCIKLPFMVKLVALCMMIHLCRFILYVYFPELRTMTNTRAVSESSPLFILVAVFLAPFTEELVFRYALYGSMKMRYHLIFIPMIISSFVFAYLHKFNTGYGSTELVALFFMSLIFTYAYEKTGSLLSSIILHAVQNAYATLSNSKSISIEFRLLLSFISLLILLITLVVFLWRKLFMRKPECVEAGEVNDALFIPQVTTTVDEVLTERCSSGQVDDTVDGTPNPPQVKTELDTQK